MRSYQRLQQMSQSPSRASHQHPLQVRTMSSPNHPGGQSTPPQQPPYPVYPLPITPEKFDRAVTLFGRLRLEEGLALRSRGNSSPHLHIPQHGRTPSVGSRTSSGPHSPSVTNSNYGGTTESVVSFNDNGSPSSATANTTGGLRNYRGDTVRQRTRRQLSPTAKAKAALIRHLGSCWVCRSRRVPCPLDHHDVDALEKGLRARPAANRQRDNSRNRSQSTPEPTRPSMVVDVTRSQSTRLPNTGGLSAPMDTFAFMGQNEALLQTPINIAADPESPMDPLLGLGAPASPYGYQNPYSPHTPTAPPANLPIYGPDRYATYQHGAMFKLGIDLTLYFQCQHLDGCQEIYADAEQLQRHFETHFAFTRILPPDRYLCSNCQNMTEYNSPMCFSCGSNGTIEHFIMGSFIRTPSYQRYTPDSHDLFGRNDASDPFSAALFPMPNDNSGMGPGMGNGGNSPMNQSGFYQQNNTYRTRGPSASPQGNNFGSYDTTQQQGFQFRGSESGDMEVESPVHSWYSKPIQTFRRHKVLLTVAMSLAVTFVVEAHDMLMTKAKEIHLQPNLPLIGFVGIMAAFAMGHTCWAIKHPPSQRRRPSQRRTSKCPLDDFSSSVSSFPSFRYRPAAPVPHIRGTIYL